MINEDKAGKNKSTDLSLATIVSDQGCYILRSLDDDAKSLSKLRPLLMDES